MARIYRITVQKRSSWPRQPRWYDHSPRDRPAGMRSQVGLQFSSVQSLSCVWPFATPWIAARQASLGSITTNKASGGDGIPVELFQILKDDAVKALHSICQQIWKTQQWPWGWKTSVFIWIPKKSNAKECSNYCTNAIISQASKVILKILQARLQHDVNCELLNVQAGFRKGRGTRDQIANIHWINKKAREF